MALTGKNGKNKVSIVACTIIETVLHLFCIMPFRPFFPVCEVFSFWSFKINSREERAGVEGRKKALYSILFLATFLQDDVLALCMVIVICVCIIVIIFSKLKISASTLNIF